MKTKHTTTTPTLTVDTIVTDCQWSLIESLVHHLTDPKSTLRSRLEAKAEYTREMDRIAALSALEGVTLPSL
tara:strand:+ start:901 stop:1116 length:216 start_codon:yes stop_codon:yes gene_type:complete